MKILKKTRPSFLGFARNFGGQVGFATLALIFISQTAFVPRSGTPAGKFFNLRWMRKGMALALIFALFSSTASAGWRDTKTSSDTFEASDYNRIIDASWNELGGDIWRASGSVGIGTTTPSSELDIVGDLEVGGTDFFVDDSAGRVGIGTTAPTAPLEVVGDFRQGNGTNYTKFAQIGSGSQIYSDRAFFFYAPTLIASMTASGVMIGSGYSGATAPTDGLLVQGNVGIGTTAPGHKLQVEDSSDNAYIAVNALASKTAGLLFESADSLKWQLYREPTTNNLVIYDQAGTSAAMTIKTNSGDVGIGTTAPGTKLSLGANIAGVNSAATKISVYENSGSTIYGIGLALGNNYGLGLYSGNTATEAPRVFIESAGNVGIGTTAPSYDLDIAGASGIMQRWGVSGGATDGFVAVNNNANVVFGSLTNHPVDLKTNNADVMRLSTSGDVGIGTTAPTTKLEVAGTIYSTTGGFKLPDGTVLDAADDLGSGKWSGSTDIYYTGGSVGIGTTAPTYTLSLGGNSNRTFWMERNTTSDTAGGALTIQSGGATSGASNKNGGTLALSSGTATGTGFSNINFYTATAGSSGSSDNSPSFKMTILGSGNVGIGTTAPGAKLEVSGIIKSTPASSATCDANTEGGIYYDSDDNNFYGCNGSEWIALSGVGTATLSSPSDGALDEQTALTLSWLAATGATSYKVYLDNNSDFSSPVVNGTAVNTTSYDVSALDAGVQYFWKIQACSATGGGGTCGSLSSSWDFTTTAGFSCGDALVDSRDSSSYSTVLIDSQCWMAENLDYGTRINLATGATDNSVTEKYCYGDTQGGCDSYGALYTWSEATNYSGDGSTDICPTDWHMPTDTEWYTLESYLATGTCTSSRTTSECDPAGAALKNGGSSGYNSLLAGYRALGGTISSFGTTEYIWSSSLNGGSPWLRRLDSGASTVYRNSLSTAYGFAVRCVRD